MKENYSLILATMSSGLLYPWPEGVKEMRIPGFGMNTKVQWYCSNRNVSPMQFFGQLHSSGWVHLHLTSASKNPVLQLENNLCEKIYC